MFFVDDAVPNRRWLEHGGAQPNVGQGRLRGRNVASQGVADAVYGGVRQLQQGANIAQRLGSPQKGGNVHHGIAVEHPATRSGPGIVSQEFHIVPS